ncbi:MAG TPA: ferrochelatase [Streptosporangiaceae bacterium]|nr:ferrochelatase [Streptosporangiaceae bacterium]
MPPYDAFLLVSFGGPEAPEDVIPFLQNVTRGRGVPRERLEQVAEHYYRFGGASPINQQCRDLIAAIEKDFAASGMALPVYWGNRNWDPYLADTVLAMTAAGVRRAIAFVTSAYSSYSSCRQYLDDIELARARAGAGAPRIDKIRQYFNHPGFIEPLADATRRAIESLRPSVRDDAELVFTAHSIPAAMAAASGPGGCGAYPAQLAEAARLVAERAGPGSASPGSASTGSASTGRRWHLAYQSRSGPPSQPWLGPDVSDCLAERSRAGAQAVVLVPVGFVSDHMEVRYDLDVEAAETARRLGLDFARADTPGTDPAFIAMITELVRERQDGPPGEALGRLGPPHDICLNGCCGAGHAAQAGRPGAQR